MGRVDEVRIVGEWCVDIFDLEEELGDGIVHGAAVVWRWHFAADEGCA